MGRRHVFWGFDYDRDLARVGQIGHIDGIRRHAAAGLKDLELWNKAKEKGEHVIKRLIDRALEGTEVSVVFLGQDADSRICSDYEIEKSLEVGNALIGIQIHHLLDEDGQADQPGKPPRKLRDSGYKTYMYFDRYKLRDWVEEALRIRQEQKPKQDKKGGSSGLMPGLTFDGEDPIAEARRRLGED